MLYILRDVATGLDVVHKHKARPTPFSGLALELSAIDRVRRSDHVCPGTLARPSAMCAECSQIVHRDVKAPNVLLREGASRWDVCISDFGTAACCLEYPLSTP